MKHCLAMIVMVLLLISSCAPTTSSNSQPAPAKVTLEELQEETPAMSAETASDELKRAVLQAVSTQRNVSVNQLEIMSENATDWPDACLGLAGPDEMCAMMLTPGWAFAVSDGQTTWQYRTDLQADQVRLAEN